MNKLVKVDTIKNLIFELRGQKVMLDKDIAQLYGVSVKRLNEQVKRNIARFPADFMFQLNEYEVSRVVTQIASPSKSWREGSRSQNATMNLKSQIATSRWGGVRKLPFAFTRNGVNMLATVLKSRIAVERSIFIMRAFSALEEARKITNLLQQMIIASIDDE